MRYHYSERMQKNLWLTPTEDEGWRAFRRMMTLLPARIDQDLQADAGLSGPDYEILSNLSEQPNQTYRLKDLATRLLWSRSRLSHQLTRMQGRGLVSKKDDTEDKRGSFAALTPLGHKAITHAAPGHVTSVRSNLIDLLSPAELRVLTDIAQRIVTNLETGVDKHQDGKSHEA